MKIYILLVEVEMLVLCLTNLKSQENILAPERGPTIQTSFPYMVVSYISCAQIMTFKTIPIFTSQTLRISDIQRRRGRGEKQRP